MNIGEIDYDKKTCVIVGVAIIVIVACGWLYYDANRNTAVYKDTDATVERIENRIDSIESRIGTMQKRLDDTEKTIERVGIGITRSTGYAIEIDEGLGRTEKRLESAVQRSERIKSIIDDVERANKP